MRELARKLFRYATVSVISTSTSLIILGTLVATGALSPGWANLVATAVGTVPSFELNRRWVWGKAGRRSLGREVGPFWALSFAGLGLSTLAVSRAAATATSLGFGNTVRALAAEGANVATFGCLWVIQYFVLDRLLFRSAERGAVAPHRAQACPRHHGDRSPQSGAGLGQWAKRPSRPSWPSRVERLVQGSSSTTTARHPPGPCSSLFQHPVR